MSDTFHWVGADVVRGLDPGAGDADWVPDPEVTYVAYPHYVRFPVAVPPPISTDQAVLLVSAVGYDATQVVWGLDPSMLGAYDWVCITRSGFGYPGTPNDGQRVLLKRRGELDPGYFTDTPLPSGRFYYYTLFIKVRSKWSVVKKDRALVPIDYQHRDLLWDRLPPFYQKYDDEQSAGAATTSALRRLFQLIGYDLDGLRTTAEGVENVWSADHAPMELFEALGEQNFGARHDAVLGDVRYRRYVANYRALAALRGTETGIQAFVETVTQYQTEVTLGRNIMLVSDDAEMRDSIGHWSRPSASLAQALGQYPHPGIPDPGLLDTVRTIDITLTAVDEKEIAAPIETRPRPALLVGQGSLKLTPKWTLDGWSESSRLCVACGVGAKTNFKGAYEQDPGLYGIPVDGERLYYMSFYSAREGTRPVLDINGQPTSGVFTFEDEDDQAEVRYGIAWYDREYLARLQNKAFSDAFGPGLTDTGEIDTITTDRYPFAGFRQVRPMDPLDVVTDALPAVPVAAKTWTQHVTSFPSPEGAEFAVPFIEILGTEVSARYITGVLIAEESGSGVEIGYGPDIFFVLGTDHRLEHQPPPNASKEYKLGPPEIR